MASLQDLLHQVQQTNSPQAYAQIARIYYNGNGVQKDHATALAYFKIAADLGSVDGQVFAGYMYYNGRGTAVNHKLAKQYWKMAADQGSTDAMRSLGWMCYRDEYGFLASKGKAFEFWMKASKLGDAESQNYVATSYLGDSWGEEQSYRKAAFWFMCSYQNRKASDAQIKAAREALDKLAHHVNLDSIKHEVVTRYPQYINLK